DWSSDVCSSDLLGPDGLSAPLTRNWPNSSTRPSSFTAERMSGLDPRPATTPFSECTRVANGSTRLRSAKLSELSSRRTRSIVTGKPGASERPGDVDGTLAAGVPLAAGGAVAVAAPAGLAGFISFATLRV